MGCGFTKPHYYSLNRDGVSLFGAFFAPNGISCPKLVSLFGAEAIMKIFSLMRNGAPNYEFVAQKGWFFGEDAFLVCASPSSFSFNLFA
jgi:hypothetical protein